MTKRQADRPQLNVLTRQIQWRLAIVLVIGLGVVVGYIALSTVLGDDPAKNRVIAPQDITDPTAPLAKFYTPEVLYWREDIVEWSAVYGLNPNVIAILMQIESCGSPEVLSWVGAVGLMQVMPFYFDDGENMLNPDTNVFHGMRIFKECLTVFADWNLGTAAACYNGGASVTLRAYADWPAETQHYYDWVSGLWTDVVAGHTHSDTLDEWLSIGGENLCEIAAVDLSSPVAAAPPHVGGVLAGP
jgi:hypothetical protein